MGGKKTVIETGTRFGKLVVKYQSNVSGRARFHCVCDCGNTTNSQGRGLLLGTSRSCGCTKNMPPPKKILDRNLYKVWKDMRYRCIKSTNTAYKNYGGRGIKVCDEWLKEFLPFYYWSLANGYKYGLEIDRKDNDGNYEPSNCQFLNKRANRQKKRNVKLSLSDAADIRESDMKTKDLSKKYNVHRSTILRVKTGKVWAS